ncbi:MAG: MlaD family protein [Cyclobacteriaceae bacterium]
MKLTKEAKVGLLAVIACTVLYVGFKFLQGIDFFSSQQTFYVIYEDIDGLTPSNPVLLSGMPVGRVTEINIQQQENNRVVVEFDVDNNIMLGLNAEVELHNSDLLGSKALLLHVGNLRNVAEDGDTLTAKVEKGLPEIIREKATPVIENIDSTLYKINLIVGELSDNRENMGRFISTMDTVAVELKYALRENRRNIRTIGNDLTKLTRTLNDDENGVEPLLTRVNGIADSIQNLRMRELSEKTAQTIESLNAILAQLDNEEGTMGKLLHNDSLYTNLNSTAADLDKLLIDLRENPGRYVHFSIFGRKNDDKKEDDD